MSVINAYIVRNVLGADFDSTFVFLTTMGTRGGILLAARSSFLSRSNPVTTSHIISAFVFDSRINLQWMLTRVYGPQGELEKKDVYKRAK
jgi:hypothetical protein